MGASDETSAPSYGVIDANSRQPSGRVSEASQRRSVTPRGDDGILHGVLGLSWVVDDREGNPIKALCLTLDEMFEVGLVCLGAVGCTHDGNIQPHTNIDAARRPSCYREMDKGPRPGAQSLARPPPSRKRTGP